MQIRMDHKVLGDILGT